MIKKIVSLVFVSALLLSAMAGAWAQSVHGAAVVYVGYEDGNVYTIESSSTVPDLAIMPDDLVVSPSGVIVGESIVVNVTVTNIGGAATTENPRVKVSYDNYPIVRYYFIGPLAAGASKTVTFTWDTTGVFEGPHWIRAEVSAVTGDPDLDNNVRVAVANVVIPPAVFVTYPWPMFSHNLNHTGHTTAPGPKTNRTIWISPTGGWVTGSPAVVGGIVYVGSGDGNVYALNATTGAQIWNYTTGAPVESSPAVVDGVIYIGSNDKNVYALNATMGSHMWNFTTGGSVISSPAIADGVVYVGSGDTYVYALDAANGSLLWSHKTSDVVYSSPAVADSVVYVGSGDCNVYTIGGRIPNLYVTNVTLLPLPYGAEAVYPCGLWAVSINVTVWNWGGQSETFQVTSYYDGKPMAGTAKLVTNLAPGANATVTITWKTAGVDPCTYNYSILMCGYIPYNISAKATNTPPLYNGTLVIRKLGDASCDGHVAGADLGTLGRSWYRYYPDIYYDWRADFTGDGAVTGADLGILGRNWYK